MANAEAEFKRAARAMGITDPTELNNAWQRVSSGGGSNPLSHIATVTQTLGMLNATGPMGGNLRAAYMQSLTAAPGSTPTPGGMHFHTSVLPVLTLFSSPDGTIPAGSQDMAARLAEMAGRHGLPAFTDAAIRLGMPGSEVAMMFSTRPQDATARAAAIRRFTGLLAARPEDSNPNAGIFRFGAFFPGGGG